MPRSSRWPDHAEIGTCYILLAIAAGVVGGVLSLSLKLPPMLDAGRGTQMAWRGAALQHGPMLVFFSAIPALLGGFGTWFVPLLIGARDTALPRLGAVAFVITAIGSAASLLGLLPGMPMLVMLAGAHLAGAGLLFCAINLLATLLNMRADGMTLGEMPLFAWSQLIACCLAVMTLPMLLGALTMLVRHGVEGGAPVSLFRFLTMPGLGIVILSGFGLAAEIVANLGGRPLVGRRLMIGAMTLLAAGFCLVWAHRLLSGGSFADPFLVPSLAMLLPVPVMAGCWIATLWQAPHLRMLLRAPGLFAFGFVLALTVGGVLEMLPRDSLGASQTLHDLPSLAAIFAVFAGFYYWIGRMTGRPYPEGLGRLQFWLLASGVLLTMLPEPMLSAAGAALTSLSILLFALIVAMTLCQQRSPVASPWGPGATTLEWRLPSPMTREAGR